MLKHGASIEHKYDECKTVVQDYKGHDLVLAVEELLKTAGLSSNEGRFYNNIDVITTQLILTYTIKPLIRDRP